MGYITNFIVYTLAMVGVIVVALLVFKNSISIGKGKESTHLKIIDSISLGQRKNLFIVSTGKEQFLVASDVNSTCLISKIDNVSFENTKYSQKNCYDMNSEEVSFKKILDNSPKQSYMDKSNLGIKSSLITKNTNLSVMKNIADILKK